MRLCQGGTLAQKLEETQGGLDEAQVKHYFRSLLSAVHYCLNVKQISHRDIKPENIMLDGNNDVFLADFGCSEFFAPINDDLSKATKGTYLFMAPEMFEGNKEKKVVKGPAVDIWAAGVTLFNLLTNRHPWEGKGVFDLAAKVKSEPPNLDLLGEGRDDLKQVLLKIFEKDPSERVDIYQLLDDPWVNDNGQNLVDLDMSISNSESQKQLSENTDSIGSFANKLSRSHSHSHSHGPSNISF